MLKKVKLKISPKRFFNKNRKGELTTQQLVGIIILVASFAIILFLLFRLNFGETSDKEICHNSVVMQSQSTLKTGSLDCKTNYVCISGGENCEEFNPTTTISVKTKEETTKAIADVMADCWWMFGEGKINYGDGFTSRSVHCAVCSVVKFSEGVKDVTYNDFYKYLSETKKDETQTYLKYLYGINDLNLLELQSQFSIDVNNDIISTNEKYSIITGVDNNLYPYDDEILKTYLIPTKDTSSKTECKNFITKA